MRRSILLTIMVLFSWGAIAQDLITFSGEFSDKSKGFEIRKEFNGFYVGFYAENVDTQQTMFNYGLNTGLSNDLGHFTAFYGVNVGMIKEIEYNSAKTSAFMAGAHAELDYNINESFYIGIKCRFDFQINNETLIRPLFKIGYKF